MNINKLKCLLIAVFYLVMPSLWSEVQCMEEGVEKDTSSGKRWKSRNIVRADNDERWERRRERGNIVRADNGERRGRGRSEPSPPRTYLWREEGTPQSTNADNGERRGRGRSEPSPPRTDLWREEGRSQSTPGGRIPKPKNWPENLPYEVTLNSSHGSQDESGAMFLYGSLGDSGAVSYFYSKTNEGKTPKTDRNLPHFSFGEIKDTEPRSGDKKVFFHTTFRDKLPIHWAYSTEKDILETEKWSRDAFKHEENEAKDFIVNFLKSKSASDKATIHKGSKWFATSRESAEVMRVLRI